MFGFSKPRGQDFVHLAKHHFWNAYVPVNNTEAFSLLSSSQASITLMALKMKVTKLNIVVLRRICACNCTLL